VWATRSVVQALGAAAGRPQGGTVHGPSAIALLLSFSLHALAEAVRLTHEFQDMGAMGEPVK